MAANGPRPLRQSLLGARPVGAGDLLLRSSALHEVAAAALTTGEVAAGDGLLAREEIHRVGAVSVEVAEEGVLPAGEGEERHWRGHPDVDADHARLHLMAVAANRRA